MMLTKYVLEVAAIKRKRREKAFQNQVNEKDLKVKCGNLNIHSNLIKNYLRPLLAI